MHHALTSRRRALLCLTALATAPWQAAWAKAFPSQAVRIIVPFSAGGAADVLARRIGQQLQARWKVPVVVDNKPGAGGAIGTQQLLRAAADGHTLLLHTASVLQQPYLLPRKPYTTTTDLLPVMRTVRGQLVLALQKDIPADSLDSFVALAKKNPGLYGLGNYGTGTTPHLQGAVFAQQAGIDITPVPYQGSAPLATALKGKHVTAAMLDIVAANTMRDTLRFVAITGPQRWHSLPDVPSFKEQGYHSLDASGWIGLFAPAATPLATAERIASDTAQVLQMPEVLSAIDAMGMVAAPSSQADFHQEVQRDDALYARIIRDTGVTL